MAQCAGANPNLMAIAPKIAPLRRPGAALLGAVIGVVM